MNACRPAPTAGASSSQGSHSFLSSDNCLLKFLTISLFLDLWRVAPSPVVAASVVIYSCSPGGGIESVCMLSRLSLAALKAVLRLSSHSMGCDFDLSPMALWRGSSTSACPGIDGAINLYAPIRPLSPFAVVGGSLSFSLLQGCTIVNFSLAIALLIVTESFCNSNFNINSYRMFLQ